MYSLLYHIYLFNCLQYSQLTFPFLVRATEVSVSESSTNLLTDGWLHINCILLGKPLVDLVSWKLSDSNIDLSLNYSTSKKGDFMLISTLLLENPSVEYSGNYSCLAGNTIGHSNEITIAGLL